MAEAQGVTWGFFQREPCPADPRVTHLIPFWVQTSFPVELTYPPHIPPERLDWLHVCKPPSPDTAADGSET